MKRSKATIYVLLLFFLSFAVGGCGIFKKKCDCPKFGKKQSEKPLALASQPTDIHVVD
jgi:hypothetical protein